MHRRHKCVNSRYKGLRSDLSWYWAWAGLASIPPTVSSAGFFDITCFSLKRISPVQCKWFGPFCLGAFHCRHGCVTGWFILMPGSKVLLVVTIDGKATFSSSSCCHNMVSFGCMSSLRDHFTSSVIWQASLFLFCQKGF